MGAEVVRTPSQRRPQVRAPYVADEQRVPGKYSVWLRRVPPKIEHQDRDRLNGVPGRLQHLQPQSRKVKRISVLHGGESVLRLGAGSKMDGRAATIAQLQVTGDEVSVEVAEKNMADLQPKFLGIGQILLDVALRVDDDGGRTVLISEQIRGVGQAAQVVLL